MTCNTNIRKIWKLYNAYRSRNIEKKTYLIALMNVQFKSRLTFSNSRGSNTKICHNTEENSFHCMLILRCVHNLVLFSEILNKAKSSHFPGNWHKFFLMDIRWKEIYLCTFRIGFKFGHSNSLLCGQRLTTKHTVVQYYKKVYTK